MTAAKIVERPPGSPDRQMWWNDNDVWQGPTARWWVPRVAYWDTGSIPSPWRSQAVDPLYFLYNSGSQFLPTTDDPMRAQLRGYQWAGNYRQPHFDPLLLFKGQAAAPPLAPLREAAAVHTVPMQNELGYQMVFFRDNGVPIGATPASTPNYVAAGPPMIGNMSFVQPIIRGEQVGVGSRPMIPNPDRGAPAQCEGHGLKPTAGPCMPPYPSCPWGVTGGVGDWPPQFAPPGTEVYGMDVGGWPVYGRAPTGPTVFPPTFPVTGYPLVAVADPPTQSPPAVQIPEDEDPSRPRSSGPVRRRRVVARRAPNPRAGGPLTPQLGAPIGGVQVAMARPAAGGMVTYASNPVTDRRGLQRCDPDGAYAAQRRNWEVILGLHGDDASLGFLPPASLVADCPQQMEAIQARLTRELGVTPEQIDAIARGEVPPPGRPMRRRAVMNPSPTAPARAVASTTPASLPMLPWPVLEQWLLAAEGYPQICPPSCTLVKWSDGHWACECEGQPQVWLSDGLSSRLSRRVAELARAVGKTDEQFLAEKGALPTGYPNRPAPARATGRQDNPGWFLGGILTVGAGAAAYACWPRVVHLEEKTVGDQKLAFKIRKHGCRSPEPYEASLTTRQPGMNDFVERQTFAELPEAYAYLAKRGGAVPVEMNPRQVRRVRVGTLRMPNPVWPWALGAVALSGMGAAAYMCRPRELRSEKVELLAGAALTKQLRFEGCFRDKPYVAILRAQHPAMGIDKEVSTERFATREEALEHLWGSDQPVAPPQDATDDDPYTPKVPPIPNPVWPWLIGAGVAAVASAGTAAYLHCRPRGYYERFEDHADVIEWERHFDGCLSKKPWRATFRLRRSGSGEILVEEIRYFDTELEADAYLASTRPSLEKAA